MELLQLEYFIALAESGHLTQTANQLMISPPSLSASITRLEKSIGYPLFNKQGRNIYLNTNGEIFYKHVKQALNSLNLAQHEIEIANGVQQDRIALAYTAPTLWGEACQTFMEQNPSILLTGMEVNLRQLLTEKCQVEHDLFITGSEDLPATDFENKVIIDNDVAGLIVRRDHRFATRKWIDLAEAKNENFVALSEDYSSRKFFDDACATAGFKPNIIVQCDYLLRSRMIELGRGITISTRLGYRSNLLNNFVFIPIKRPELKRTQCIFWKKKQNLSPICVKFRNFLVAYFKQERFNSAANLKSIS